MKTINVSLAVFALILGMMRSVDGSTFTFADQTFNNDDWSLSVAFNSTATSSYSANQILDGGNLGPYRSTDLTFGQGYLVVNQLNDFALLSPTSAGAIDSIDFSYDFLKIAPTGPSGAIYYSMAILQNGILYGLNPGNAPNDQNWASHSHLNLTALDFSNFIQNPSQGSQQLYGANHPDFSVNGGTMQFGYLTGNDTTAGLANSTSGLDNWSVTVRTVPEPSSTILLLVGASFAILRRKSSQ